MKVRVSLYPVKVPFLTTPVLDSLPPIDSFKKHGRLPVPLVPQHAHNSTISKRRPTGLPLVELSQIREEDYIRPDESVRNLINTYDSTGPTNGSDGVTRCIGQVVEKKKVLSLFFPISSSTSLLNISCGHLVPIIVLFLVL